MAQTGFHIRQARKAGAGGVGQLQRLAVWVSPPLLQCVRQISLMHLMLLFFQESARAGSVGRGDVDSFSYRDEYYQLFESRFFFKLEDAKLFSLRFLK